ncbi:MAG: hypothetical protein R3F14_12755 [Polyangiaceae bacterium]
MAADAVGGALEDARGGAREERFEPPDPLQVSPQAVAEVSVALESVTDRAREAAGAA